MWHFKNSLVLLFVFILWSSATEPDKRKTHFNTDSYLALGGYDPVAYFKLGKAVQGKKSLSVSADGIVYYFSTPMYKELFLKNYASYEPQYGGWCAYAMGKSGEKVKINPETFKIVNGKLYLFYNAFFNNTLTDWNKNESTLMAKANIHWTNIYR